MITKNIILFIVVFLSLSIFLGCTQEQIFIIENKVFKNPQKIPGSVKKVLDSKKSLDSTVRLAVRDTEGKSRKGSGFFVTSNLVVTDFYVVKGIDKDSAKLKHKRKEYSIERIIPYKENGLALLKVNTPGSVRTKLSFVNSNAIKYPSKVYVLQPSGSKFIGNIIKRKLVERQGIISGGFHSGLGGSGSHFSEKKKIIFHYPISREVSGGPVLDEKGEVIGVTVYDKEAAYIIPSETLKAVLKGQLNNK